MVWFNKVEKPKSQKVIAVKLRDKGVVVETKDYDCFLYASSKIASHLIAALSVWNENTGPELMVVPDKSEKNGFKIQPVANTNIEWYLIESGFSTQKPDEEDDTNPFLQPPSPSKGGKIPALD